VIDLSPGQFLLVLFLAMIACVVACAYGSYLLARKLPHSVNVILAGFCVAGMLLFSRHLTNSVFVASILPPTWLPIFGNWLPPLSGLLAGFGWVLSSRDRRIKLVVMGSFLAMSMYLPYRALLEPRPLVANRFQRGIYMQTTNATCGAAAAATLLHTIGIRTTEREMVDLCFSTWRGTSLHNLLRGIAVKLEGTEWRVRVKRLTPEQLADLEAAAILEVGLPGEELPEDLRYVTEWGWIPGVMHTAVLFRVREDGLLDIGDPSTGRELWRREALDVLWHGVAITLEKRK